MGSPEHSAVSYRCSGGALPDTGYRLNNIAQDLASDTRGEGAALLSQSSTTLPSQTQQLDFDELQI